MPRDLAVAELAEEGEGDHLGLRRCDLAEHRSQRLTLAAGDHLVRDGDGLRVKEVHIEIA